LMQKSAFGHCNIDFLFCPSVSDSGFDSKKTFVAVGET